MGLDTPAENPRPAPMTGLNRLDMDQPLPKPVPDSSDSERRLEKLEEQLTFQQRALDQLNEVVFQQQSDLAKLRLQWTSCRAEVDRLAELELGDDLPHEKPPHY